MNVPPPDNARHVRWGIYLLLIAVALGSTAARMFLVDDPHKPHPFLSANDRSRWATVRSLVENHTYEIDEIIAEPGWDTIDKVQHNNRFGVKRYYSSKPPILATMVAGLYWPIYHSEDIRAWFSGKEPPADTSPASKADEQANAQGGEQHPATSPAATEHRYTLKKHPHDIALVILAFTNLLPLFIYLVVMGKFAERYGRSTWGRMFFMAVACFGTYLSTFSTVLNNHLPGAAAAAIAIYATCRIWFDHETRLRYFFLAGLFAAFAAAMEIPAVALLCALGLLCLLRAPGRTLLVGLPAVGVVAAGFFTSNYAAHQPDIFKLPYMHRSLDAEDPDNWYAWEGSPWLDPNERGFDAGEPDTQVYAFHALVGHHGVFSLTPVWLLSVLGFLGMLLAGPGGDRRLLALLLGCVIAVVLAFWILFIDPQQRNYGGTAAGFREVHWLIPPFLVLLLPAADLFAKSRVLKFVAVLLLIASTFSVTYNVTNPWTHPWITDWMGANGMLPAEKLQ